MELSALDPKELVVLTVILLGAIPVVLQYRKRSKWFTVGYGLLVVGALSTNLEALFLGDLLNLVEHSVGLMGSGLVFLAAAYLRRENVLNADDGEAIDG